ncbi:protein lifeguard 2-like isoform X2 [Babylonia areolata]|uniref:protein lifeguard 2-like isoform X2 n=1 Tax=Babylonia areolata TaxID=304850 RepID=UPI003FD1EE70
MAQPQQPPPQYGYAQNYPETNPGYGVGRSNYGYGETDSSNPASSGPNRMDDYPDETHVDGINASSFSDKAIRRAFIRKVYLILTAQLLVTVAFIAVFIFVEPVKDWVQNDGLWFYIAAYVTFLITYIVLVCCPSVRRNYPGNFICLGVFTVAFSYMTGTISSFHDTEIVLLAAGITAAVCISISIFAIQTKIDFTMCSGLLFALLMVLFFFGWACLITYYIWGYNHILNCVYAGLGALVFALFLIYDTQMIMGGKKIELSPEEYIYGALQLYIDVVYIFLYLLALFGKSN